MNEYPTEEELKKIQEWPYTDATGLMTYIRDLWEYESWKEFTRKDGARIYRIATYGWSGNEDIINAMSKNVMFWIKNWYLTKRGGLYIFIVEKT